MMLNSHSSLSKLSPGVFYIVIIGSMELSSSRPYLAQSYLCTTTYFVKIRYFLTYNINSPLIKLF